ncbi:MAG: rRNA adenine N-6-methyltransferase family protein [Candidatus Caldarchaeum sp.]
MEQHFLVDGKVVDRLVEAADVEAFDVVVDVGAGKGVIAEKLARKALRVYAVEADPAMLPYLARLQSQHSNLQVFISNFLTAKLPLYNKVVANPPFSILEPLIQLHLRKPTTMSLLAPSRFAERLAARQDTLLVFKVRLAYDARVLERFNGDVLDPPYPGKVSLLVLNPVERGYAEKIMLEFLSQRTSKVRNALRNVFWTHMTKRQATRLVELSPLPEKVLNKPVRRLSCGEAEDIYRLISRQVVNI